MNEVNGNKNESILEIFPTCPEQQMSEINEEQPKLILHQAIKSLIRTRSLDSSKFNNHLSQFNSLIFLFIFPSDDCDTAYKVVSNMIDTRNDNKIQLGAFITELKRSDCKYYYNAKLIKIDSTCEVIEKKYFYLYQSLTHISLPSSITRIKESVLLSAHH